MLCCCDMMMEKHFFFVFCCCVCVCVWWFIHYISFSLKRFTHSRERIRSSTQITTLKSNIQMNEVSTNCSTFAYSSHVDLFWSNNNNIHLCGGRCVAYLCLVPMEHFVVDGWTHCWWWMWILILMMMIGDGRHHMHCASVRYTVAARSHVTNRNLFKRVSKNKYI